MFEIPRFIHKLYARIKGYFWLPCPLCGKMFGGHEAKEAIGVDTMDGRIIAVCPDIMCAYEAGILDSAKDSLLSLRPKTALFLKAREEVKRFFTSQDLREFDGFKDYNPKKEFLRGRWAKDGKNN